MLEVFKDYPAGYITANSQIIGPMSLGSFTNVLVMIHGTYSGVNITWEASMDMASWVGVQGVRSDAGTAELNSGALSSTVRAWDIYVGPFNFFRVRSTAFTSGAATIWMVADTSGADPAIVATLNGTVQVSGGQSGHSSATSVVPLMIGGQAKSAVDTTMADGDACYLTLTTGRQVVTKDFCGAELDWQYTSYVASTTTTAAAAKAAGAASVRNYVTAAQVQNTSATATVFQILDGATIIWQCNLTASMDKPVTVVFPTPLRGTAATALNYNFGAAGAAVLLNIQGFQNF